jgi:hypothetical protein
MIYQGYRVGVRGCDEARAALLIDEVEERMREADRRAMEDEEAYWPVIVEQMRGGML